jgi:hypothetical protein
MFVRAMTNTQVNKIGHLTWHFQKQNFTSMEMELKYFRREKMTATQLI